MIPDYTESTKPVWSDEEISKYQQLKSKKLNDIYASQGIPASDPEARAKHLCENVLEAGMTDQDLIMRTAATSGRHVALNLLEKMALAQEEQNPSKTL